MILDGQWTDLLDPTLEEIGKHLPAGVHDSALEQLQRPTVHDDEPRPKLEAHGEYVFGVLLVAVVGGDEGVFYQEIDLIMTRDRLLTIRKTPANGSAPYDISDAQHACRTTDAIGMVIYHLVDDIAERYLDLVDRLDDAIEALEDGIDDWEPAAVRRRISQLRHDMLHIRRTLSPLRDMLRQVVDDRIEFDGEEVFTRDVELCFAAAYDKMLRASDGLELSRDLVSSARDYAQAKISNDQNEVMKRLTVIASVLLLPTFIVGLYGQNFHGHDMPELFWHWGYAFSWGLIILTTVAQIVYFKWKKWV
jgi:magnesium transporter